MEHRGAVPPKVDKQMTLNMKHGVGSKVNSSTDWSCEVVGFLGSWDVVMLTDRKWSCMVYDRIGMPCWYALMAADSKGVSYETLVKDWYKTGTWVGTYQGEIVPELNPMNVEDSHEVDKRVLLPPRTRSPSGRPCN